MKRKNRIIAVLMCLALYLTSYSQETEQYEYTPIVKDGIQRWYVLMVQNDDTTTIVYELLDEDTVMECRFSNQENTKDYINGYDTAIVKCKNLYRIYDNGDREFMYKLGEYDKRVVAVIEGGYYRDLYDFRGSVGTIIWGWPEGANVRGVLRIKQDDTVFFAGKMRRILTMINSGQALSLQKGYFLTSTGRWVEGIGNIDHYLFTPYDQKVICYEYNGEMLYHNDQFDYCFYKSLNNETPESSVIKIIPNPAKDNVCIKSDNKNISSVNVLNTYGQIILSEYVNNNNVCLDVSKLSRGLYIIKIHYADGETVIKRVILT